MEQRIGQRELGLARLRHDGDGLLRPFGGFSEAASLQQQNRKIDHRFGNIGMLRENLTVDLFRRVNATGVVMIDREL